MAESASPDQLNTWQEIAEFLGVSIRTAQNYEQKAGLPVYRLPGEKARVWASRAELLAWRTRSSQQAQPVSASTLRGPVDVLPTRRAGRLIVIPIVIVVVFGTVLASWMFRQRRASPATFSVKANDLIVSDVHGREIWRHTFPSPLLEPVYNDSTERPRMCRFVDLDGDGRSEVLFQYRPVDYETNGTALFCFSSTGSVKWQFVPRGSARDLQEQLQPPFFCTEALFLPGTRSFEPRIITTSIHARSHPGYVVLLDTAGKVKAEYWHSGHVAHLASTDMDGDGVPEVLLGGVNNGYQRATLVVLDPRRMFGASTQPPGDHRQIQGVGQGAEKAVLLFRKTCIATRHAEYNRVYSVRVVGETIQVFVMEDVSEHHPRHPYVVYEFDRQLRLLHITISDQFVSWHKTLQSDGRLDHAYSEAEVKDLYTIEVLRPAASASRQ